MKLIEIKMICVDKGNHLCVVYFGFNSRKIENMPQKHDTLRGALAGPQYDVVNI